jgi:hypothetical protein
MDEMTRFEAELRTLAEEIQPDAQFAHDLEAHLFMPKEHKMLRLRRYGLGLVAGLGLMLMLTLTLPPLRTLAQEIIDSLFNQLDSDTTTHAYTRDEPETDVEVRIHFDSVEDAELSTQGRINIVEPAMSAIPQDYLLTGVTFNANIRPEVREGITFSSITYERKQSDEWMALNVMQSSLDLDWGFVLDVGVSATITAVMFEWGGEEIAAQYVEGNWIRTEKYVDDNRVTEVYEWDPTVPVRRLSWTHTNTFYVVQAVGTNPENPGYIDLDAMIEIAESMYADLSG